MQLIFPYTPTKIGGYTMLGMSAQIDSQSHLLSPCNKETFHRQGSHYSKLKTAALALKARLVVRYFNDQPYNELLIQFKTGLDDIYSSFPEITAHQKLMLEEMPKPLQLELDEIRQNAKLP